MAEDKQTKWSKFVDAGKDLINLKSNEPGVGEQIDQPNMIIGAHVGRTLSSSIFSIPFDGEKNLGEMGPIKDYYLEYDLLRLRSWQSYLESEITQTVLGKFTKWILGSGLKLQSEPITILLKQESIELDVESFSKNVEARFGIYSKSKSADFSNMESLNKIAKTAFVNAKVGGDVLVILRLIKGVLKVELVDGEHVRSKRYGFDIAPIKLENGNYLVNGIEMNKNGEHIAYHVMKSNWETQIIKAKTRTGLTQAFLIYGFKYRMSNKRGIPLLSVVLESMKKLERYKEATVGSAEERQKIAYFIKHGISSTGENPLNKTLSKAFNVNGADDNLPKDINGTELANTISASTNKQTFNMPVDSELEMLESKNELYFKDFYSVNIGLICSCIGIPPEVAMSKYDSNFSASRAALKDWEHTILIEREDFTEQFYSRIYEFWFEVNVLQNKINAPGYLTAKKTDLIKESYQNARFIGAGVPHIDPLKEVKAEREKLGPAGKNIPLTTVEKATESLNTGDSEQNLVKFTQEVGSWEKTGIKINEPSESDPKQNSDGD